LFLAAKRVANGFVCNKFDFDRIAQMSFAASDPTIAAARQAMPLSLAPVLSMFAWSRRGGFSDRWPALGLVWRR
jgi:hypothetical protein